MIERTYNVLFLCTGNSARSIVAESLVSHCGKGKFVGYSAGSFPKGQVHPVALALLKQLGLPAEGMRVLETRIKAFVSLPLASLDRLALEKRLRAIGQSSPSA
jgi:protein-tyrosine-phosphatase